MELTSDITKMFRTKYETKWNTQIQQDTSLVKPYVTLHPNCSGKSVSLPFHGKTDIREYTGRKVKLEWDELDFGERHIKKRKFYSSIPLSEDDKLDMDTLDLTASNVMAEQRNALQRTYDEVILGVGRKSGVYEIRTQADGVCGGIFAPNYVGENGDELETLDLTAGSSQVIPVDYAAKGTKTPAGMLIDKIAELRRRYRAMDVPRNLMNEIVVAISPSQEMDMILWEQSQNRDYGFTSLTTGEVNKFLKCTFFVTNMLPVDAEGNRLCVAWLKSRVKFGPWKEATFRIEPRPEYVDVREQITVKAAMGATRLDNKTVFVLPCKEATA